VYKPEIDQVLARHLGRVAAPEELWERIQNPQVPARMPTRHARVRALLAVAVMMLVVAVAVNTRRGTEQNTTPSVSKAALTPVHRSIPSG